MEKSSHPTAMMLTSTVNLLKTLSLSAGIYAEVLQADATRTLCGLLRMLVESGASDKSGRTLTEPGLGGNEKASKVLLSHSKVWLVSAVRLSLQQAGVPGAAPQLVHAGIHPQHRPHAPDVQHAQHLGLDRPPHPHRGGAPVVQRHHSAETGSSKFCPKTFGCLFC